MPRSDHVHPIVASWADIGRSMEGKDLAGFGQKLLKSRSESEWKANLLFTIDLCVSQHKVINTDSCPEICVETLPAEWMMSIHSGIAGPVGGNIPHGSPMALWENLHLGFRRPEFQCQLHSA